MISRVIRRCSVIIKIKRYQKSFGDITYLFIPEKSSKSLMVGFSGFSPIGKPPRYNYIETVKDIKANRLFILDNHGYNKAGCYYLGEYGRWYLKDQIIKLIYQIKKECGAENLIFFGTSKGGQCPYFMEYSARLML